MKLVLFLFITLFAFGQDITKELKSFTAIDLSVSAKTKIFFGDEHKVEISGTKKALKRLIIEEKNNTLIIKRKGKNSFFNWSRSNKQLTIKITTKKLDNIEISGSGVAFLPAFDQERLDLDISGSVDVEAEGRITTVKIEKSGSGNLYFTDLKSNRLTIDRSGSGNMEVIGTTEKLTIESSGSGDLDWKDIDADKINIEASGSGSFSFTGKAKQFNVDLSGSGDVKAKRLIVGNLVASTHGSSDIRITVEKTIEADLSGSGDLRYHGNAKVVRSDRNGSGKVKRY